MHCPSAFRSTIRIVWGLAAVYYIKDRESRPAIRIAWARADVCSTHQRQGKQGNTLRTVAILVHRVAAFELWWPVRNHGNGLVRLCDTNKIQNRNLGEWAQILKVRNFGKIKRFQRLTLDQNQNFEKIVKDAKVKWVQRVHTCNNTSVLSFERTALYFEKVMQ